MIRSFRNRQVVLWTLTLILIAIAASRIARLTIVFHDDEVWTAWQGLTSNLSQLISWTPYDWPPLYFPVAAVWRSFVGLHPIVLRTLSVFFFLISSAAFYRVARRLIRDEYSAILSLLFYAGMSIGLFHGNMFRGYSLAIMWAPITLWLAIRYFTKPSWQRGFWVGLLMAAMFYTHFTTVFSMFMIGVITLALYPRKIWRWWLPGLIGAVIIAPLALDRLKLAQSYSTATQTIPTLRTPFGPLMLQIFGFLVGHWAVIGAVLVLLTTVLIRFKAKNQLGRLALALGLWVVMPVILYLLYPLIGYFISNRLLWWLLPGYAMWMGIGLALLLEFIPAPVRTVASVAAAILVLVTMFLPDTITINQVDGIPDPLSQDMAWLKEHMQRYDVILLDPKLGWSPVQWYYYSHAYFPEGLQFVTSPEGHRRVWYISNQTNYDTGVYQAVSRNRVESIFVGEPATFFRLYEGPPDAEGILFENGMRFHGLEEVDSQYPGLIVRHENETFKVRLWWSVDKPIGLQYSSSLFIIRDGVAAIQSDGPVVGPDVPKYTDQWRSGRFYIEEREITVPNPFRTASYPIYLTVYQPWDSVKISAPGVNADKLLVIGTLNIKEW